MTARDLYNALGVAFANGLDYDAPVDMLCPTWGDEDLVEVRVHEQCVRLIPKCEG